MLRICYLYKTKIYYYGSFAMHTHGIGCIALIQHTACLLLWMLMIDDSYMSFETSGWDNFVSNGAKGFWLNLQCSVFLIQESASSWQPLQLHDCTPSAILNQPNDHVHPPANQHRHCTCGVATASCQQENQALCEQVCLMQLKHMYSRYVY